MGKPTGFLEFQRELPTDRSAGGRVADWKEFHHHLPEADLKKQGARCMDCGIPFCHTGQLVSGMASGCPIHNLIPEWNDLVIAGCGKKRLNACTRRIIFRSSPAASAPRRAKAPACWASTI